MKQISLLLILILSTIASFGQGLTKEQQKLVSNFIVCVKTQNKEKVVSLTRFPLIREYPIPQIKNGPELLKRYIEVFDEKLISLISNSQPTMNWSEVGWKGIMLNNGDVWLDSEGKLISINYQSFFKLKRKKELIEIERNLLHSSIKNYINPIIILETSKYKIRIDDLGKGNYRLALWPLLGSMIDKPELVIKEGRYIPDGSGGNHYYEFVNGDYTYSCYISVLREEKDIPAELTIYKRKDLILKQDAYISEPIFN